MRKRNVGFATGMTAGHRLEGFLQALREKSMSPRFALSASLLVFAAAVLLSEALLRFREAESLSQRNTAAMGFASELRARVDRELNSVLYLASGIVGYLVVRHDRLDADEINRILGAVHVFGRHVRNFSISIDYRITYVFPIEGNEQALNRDYRDIPEQWPIVKMAVESGSSVLTGPVALLQGGSALIYRTPVRVNGKHWGLLSTVIDMTSFQSAAFLGLDKERFDFAVRSRDFTGAGDVFVGSPKLFDDPSAIILQSDVPGGRWVYAVRARQPEGFGGLPGIRLIGGLLAALAAFSLHTVLRQRGELARHAGFDSLTGLPNRRLFDDRLDQAIRRQARTRSGLVAALFLDLDGFKQINDRYGHKIGDVVLKKVAIRLRSEVRLADTVARWAGDEFAIVLEDASRAYADQLVERLRECIARPIEIEGVPLATGTSVGVAFYPDEAVTAQELLELADQRMFADKERRRNA